MWTSPLRAYLVSGRAGDVPCAWIEAPFPRLPVSARSLGPRGVSALASGVANVDHDVAQGFEVELLGVRVQLDGPLADGARALERHVSLVERRVDGRRRARRGRDREADRLDPSDVVAWVLLVEEVLRQCDRAAPLLPQPHQGGPIE